MGESLLRPAGQSDMGIPPEGTIPEERQLSPLAQKIAASRSRALEQVSAQQNVTALGKSGEQSASSPVVSGPAVAFSVVLASLREAFVAISASTMSAGEQRHQLDLLLRQVYTLMRNPAFPAEFRASLAPFGQELAHTFGVIVDMAIPAKGPGMSPTLTFHTVTLADSVPQVPSTIIEEKNRGLTVHGCVLRCREFRDLKDPARILRPNIEQFCRTMTQTYQPVVRGLFEQSQLITFDQLKKAIVSCTEELNRELDHRNCVVGYANGKSNKWIAEQVLPFMETVPVADFPVLSTVEGQGFSRATLHPDTNAIVVCDDASYSGSQVEHVIRELIPSLRERQTPVDIYVVIPFISSSARRTLQQKVAAYTREGEPLRINVHVLTSNVPIRTVAEACENIGLVDTTHVPLEFAGDECMALTEWKIPDTISVPEWLTRNPDTGERFVTSVIPPYKPGGSSV